MSRHPLVWGLSCLLLWAAAARADNWPQWRGPTLDGVSAEKNLPTRFDAKTLVWKAPLPGMGGSTPIVWGDKIFLTTEDGGDLALVCLSTAGKQLWKRSLGLDSGKKRFMKDEANQASASPSTDGKHVWAFFGTGDFLCCDMGGKVVWRFNAQERYGKFNIYHGVHITPLLHGDRLYWSLLHTNARIVLALDKLTGKEIWKVDRVTDGTDECEQAYASPVLWRDGPGAGKEYLVQLGCDYCTAHSLKDGAEIWRVGDLNPKKKYDKMFRIIASPAASRDVIVIPSARDGPLVGVRPEAQGYVRVGSRSELWRQKGGQAGPGSKTPDVPAPLIHDGLVYVVREYRRESGALICLDARTGKELYYEAIHESRYRASPVWADGHLYLAARDGTITVVKAGRKFEVVSTSDLNDLITASPSVANGRIYLRGFRSLYAFTHDGK